MYLVNIKTMNYYEKNFERTGRIVLVRINVHTNNLSWGGIKKMTHDQIREQSVSASQ